MIQRHGWFIIPGVQTGDRTIEEQLVAVRDAIAECAGKTVLDVGCAEGLIGLEFARAGAKQVHGLENVREHLQVAYHMARGQKNITFEQANLNEPRPVVPYDIVVVLGIIHKLHYPETGLRWAAACTKELLLIRSGRGERDGLIHSKHRPQNVANRDAVLKDCGLVYDKTVRGPDARGEDVQYWRRAAA